MSIRDHDKGGGGVMLDLVSTAAFLYYILEDDTYFVHLNQPFYQ